MKESLRSEIVSRFTDWAWADATDEDIAVDVRVRTEVVRELRAAWRRDVVTAEVLGRASELAALVGWPGSVSELILHVLGAEIARAESRTPSDIMLAITEARRLAHMESAGDG